MPSPRSSRAKLHAADLFCGAGGTSAGLMDACTELGIAVDLTAVNHWDIAVATHTANHPHARHLCASLDSLNPRELYREGQLKLLWASPECTHHSVARGGKPIHDQSRATAWCVVRWAEALRPDIVLVENVKEFRSWGPLRRKRVPLTGKARLKWRRQHPGQRPPQFLTVTVPDPKRKGEIFRSWIANLEAIGYRVDHRVLCAADYGDPTTRERLFVQAVRRGSKYKLCWPEPTHAPTAHTDLLGSRQAWVPARDIIDWSHKGVSIFDRKKPLADNTLRRIMIGLERFGLNSLIIGQQSDAAARPASQPAPTVATSGAIGLADPCLVKLKGTNTVADVNRPTPTVTGSHTLGVMAPCLVEVNHGKNSKTDNHRVRSVQKPLGVVTGSRGTGLCEFVLQIDQTGGNSAGVRPTSQPVGTIVTKANHAVVAGQLKPFILPREGVHRGNAARAVEAPLPTITTNGGGGIVEPRLSPIVNRKSEIVNLVEPHVVKFYGSGISKPVSATLDAVTTKERFGLVEYLLHRAKQGGRPLVQINGVTYELDILFRMLQWRELARAQGFAPDYQFTGNTEAKVKQIGNAVPRRLARALVKAVLTGNPNVA